ncbi:nuclear protein [Penicillium chermesinum]|uniref:Non-structural maintenance of chromosomes element 4 n=1 Tax=Penicillium chermesinum TaxID=63820 RepID=A0A9W9TRV0_9EURO|nr:nuclear protein [Penicillium chermesinum]KAJ5238867.1 nuclear protein [Penicillium chermesinum]
MARVPLSQLDQTTAPSSPDSSSDKENPRNHKNQRNTVPMSQSQSKRRRLSERNANTQSQMPSSQRNNHLSRHYDPDQDPEERRREFNDHRTEYMRADHDGILKTLEKQNELFNDVKQTSDATADSGLMVKVAEVASKRAGRMALGNTGAGIDVDEFVSKCINYMRNAPRTMTATQSQGPRRHRQTQRASGDSDDDEGSGEPMNWEWLGRNACLPYNARPGVSGFLLGPLSVQKRARQQTQRSAREQFDPSQLQQPKEMQQEDLASSENFNLTEICSNINKLLAETQAKFQSEAFENLGHLENVPKREKYTALLKYRIADDGGIPLFHFVINPRSFGQSVENMFYVSFLVRDGAAAVSMDSEGQPTLHASQPFAPSEAQRQGIQKHQAVFSLDCDLWEELIQSYDIKDSIIPHREEKEETNATWA